MSRFSKMSSLALALTVLSLATTGTSTAYAGNVRDHRGSGGAAQGGVSVGPGRGNGLCRHQRCLYGNDHTDHRLPNWGFVRDHRTGN